MTADEARKVQQIANANDQSTQAVAAAMNEMLVDAFPEHADVLVDEFHKRWPE